jgi:hypothetical protein
MIKRDLIYAHKGNGFVVADRLHQKNGDYETVARINVDRAVTYFAELSNELKQGIENFAQYSNPTISSTQDQFVFRVEALPENNPNTIDMRGDLVVQVDYTYSDCASARIIEECPQESLKGCLPEDLSEQAFLLAKDQYGSEIELTTDMDGQSLNSKVIKQSPEALVIQSMTGVAAFMDQLKDSKNGNKVDIGGIVSKNIEVITSQLKHLSPDNDYFAKAAKALSNKISSPDNQNFLYSGKPIAESVAIKEFRANRSREIESPSLS